MDRKSLLITGFVAVLAAAGVAFYERELFQLRAELEQSRLREARAAAALKAAGDRALERAAAQARAMADKAAAERASAEAQAAAARMAAENAIAQRTAAKAAQQAAAAAAAAAAKPPIAPSVSVPPPGTGSGLLEQAQALEREGKGPQAVRAYVRAARGGSGAAAKRLGEIYDQGIEGVSRDHAESLKWFNAARVLGEDVPTRKLDEAMRQAVEAAEREKRAAAEAARRAAEAREEAARRALEAERKSPFIKEPYRPDSGPYAASLAPLLDEAAALEAAGRGPDAVKLYERAARSGSGKAALRLGEIYEKGIAGVAADYQASLRWRNAARVLGEDLPLRR